MTTGTTELPPRLQRVTHARLRAQIPGRRIAGVRFDAMRAGDVIEVVCDAVRRQRRLRLSFANAEFAIEGVKNAALQRYLDDCDLVLADGSSIVTASRFTGDAPPLPTRVTGTDFVHALGAASAEHGLRLAFVGGKPGIAVIAAHNLMGQYPGSNVVLSLDGYDDLADPAVAIARLNAANADVVMVCLGNPRQEAWIAEHDAALTAPVIFGNGGALDFTAGAVTRAPQWVQDRGMEWAYRLVQDPTTTRLRRQLRLPLFVWLALRQSAAERFTTSGASRVAALGDDMRRHMAHPYAGRLARAVSWNAAGTIIARLLTLASSILVGRTLGLAGFGAIGVLQQTVTLLVTVTALGLPTTLTTDLAAARTGEPRRVGALVGAGLLLATIVSTVAALLIRFGGPTMAARVLGVSSLAAALPAAAVLLVAQALTGMQIGALSGLERFRAVAAATVLAGATALTGAAVGARMAGVTGAVWGLALGSCVNVVAVQLMLRHACRSLGTPMTLRNARASIRHLWQTARAATLTNLMVVGTTWAVTVVLAHQDHGTAAVGLLTLGMQWRAAVLALPLTASTPLLSILSSLRHDGASRRFIGTLACAVAGGIATIGALVVAAASPALVRAYGRGFDTAVPIMVMLAASAIPLAVAGMLGQLALGRGDRRSGVFACVAWSVTLLAGCAILTPRYGAAGAALATLIAAPVQVAILWKRSPEYRT